ncbi:5-formyltetrahydrofolate cyclo-ligase [Brevibacillus ruminantium]|uniref:5-formyltetrahydrofolate cyclo-ligase n=1 Tax=Brevibacillus ruminantium TaxID=2950604 RepID=A0ABY4WJW8_9BACL|nr:5-formyltetrahydrofolate cyclo-ligase [Brevibacillus ruminantium]
MLAERAAVDTAVRSRWSEQFCRALLSFDQLRDCQTIMAFYPFREELDIRAFLERARERGKEIWLPLTLQAERKIVPYVYTGPAMLKQGAYGIWEPDPDQAVAGHLPDLDAVLVPGVAFDPYGGRMGYGAGYYDRFLSSLSRRPLLIGCSFELQVIPQVPMEPHDIPLDYLATETGIRPRIRTE